ncbi:hypothetical protein [Pseudoxanthomonas japonensis]|uniref:hypothetical protein n=1 Tax=Pseudoxanthomonas japonensis TaxID=69284 RepID=UPI001390F61C|nr:hypothetical protein [Pseudoxanthomonas japonensis]
MALKSSCKRTGGAKVVLVDPDGGVSKFVVDNENKKLSDLIVYNVDGCLIVVGERCDYLVFPNAKAAVFVELKGADVNKGLSQLKTTIKALAASVGKRIRYAVLVPTRWPLPHYELQRAQDEFRSKYACRLKVKNLVFQSSSNDW